jgi:hypothetical protein
VKTLDELAQLFSMTAERDAHGYATGFHAGVAAIQREVARELLAIRHDSPRLRELLLDMAVQPATAGSPQPKQLAECHPAHGQRHTA